MKDKCGENLGERVLGIELQRELLASVALRNKSKNAQTNRLCLLIGGLCPVA